MKHRFLLDENIIYHAILGVDDQDRPDATAGQLVYLISRNCHRIFLNPFLRGKYLKILDRVGQRRPKPREPIALFASLLKNSLKLVQDYTELPSLPQGITVPNEDVDIVRCALIARPIIVSADGELRDAVNGQPMLELTAKTPNDAIALAEDS